MDRHSDLITIVVPCHNEAACLPSIVERVAAVLAGVDVEYEMILVDDGSGDNTFQVMKELCLRHPRLSCIRFVRNFGKEAALLAGLRHARGDAIAMIDADLQHPPELLPEMIAKWRAGYDVVQTVRQGRPTLTRSVTGKAFYLVLNWLSEIRIPDGISDFRLISRRTVDALIALPEETKFLRGQVAWLGFPTTILTFEAPDRLGGESTYGFRKLMRLATDAIVTLTSGPLHLALYVAGVTLLVALAYTAFVLVAYARGLVLVKGWTSTILLILFLGTANLFCTGILGLYLRAVLAQIRRRPTYLISEYAPGWVAHRELRDVEVGRPR
jgi:polyisoprenyl-phosphate glycosyltransferase